jgi:hypothetical protein
VTRLLFLIFAKKSQKEKNLIRNAVARNNKIVREVTESQLANMLISAEI